MTIKDLITNVIDFDKKYLDYEIKFYKKTAENTEILIPINAIGISDDKEILLSDKCPNCDD